MDLNRILLWMVWVICGINLIRVIPLVDSPWRRPVILPALVLLLTGLFSYLTPDLAGLLGGVCLLVLLLIPGLCLQQIATWIGTQNYQPALRLSTLLQWPYGALHRLQELPPLLQAMLRAEQGDLGQARDLLHGHLGSTTWIGRLLIPQIFRSLADWDGLFDWVSSRRSEPEFQQDLSILVPYLRTLGETGRLNDLVEAFQKLQPQLTRSSNPTAFSLSQLFVLAFCGETEQVQRLLQGSLVGYPPAIQQFWLATADLVRGERAKAEQSLLAIGDSGGIAMQRAIQRRLTYPLPHPDPVLTHSCRQILQQLQVKSNRHGSILSQLTLGQAKPWATYGIIGLNLAVFGLEVALGGSTNDQVLAFLGGLIPTAVVAGGWWRLLAATLLHYGWLHLVMNMLGLWYLGPFVEIGLGVPRYLLVYWGSGVGSMLVITLMSVSGMLPDQFVVGASGCIMGLIGATAALLLQVWLQERSHSAFQQLRLVGLIIALQAVFDLTNPQISFVGHTAGLLIGFGLGFLLTWRRGSRS
jgi:rhomboid protease GluP